MRSPRGDRLSVRGPGALLSVSPSPAAGGRGGGSAAGGNVFISVASQFRDSLTSLVT